MSLKSIYIYIYVGMYVYNFVLYKWNDSNTIADAKITDGKWF